MRLRRRHLVAASVATITAALALYLIFGSAGSNDHRRPRQVPFKSYSRAENVLFAKRIASRMRDNATKEIEIVNSTRTAALRLTSPGEEVVDETAGDASVRVFAMRGRFTEVGSRPRGSGPPLQATWLMVSVDQATGQVLDLSLTDKQPKLSTLGKVQRIG